MSRSGLCSAIVSVAQANDLPIPFFANLIWQESSFRSRTISPAGALGIAQFIPETAVEHGLMNPFEPLHALFASGKLLRKLNDQFGNLGLAAAAYNAGPQRMYDWMAGAELAQRNPRLCDPHHRPHRPINGCRANSRAIPKPR